ncbi:MAG: Flp family type IVb pilin [Sphingomonas sp.]|jgi:pilus assembly protein Flp/PilA
MMIKIIRRLARNRRGGTAIEYGLIAALVVITMIATFMQVANSTVGLWQNTNTKMEVARAGG